MKKTMFLILLSIFMISSSAQAANTVRAATSLIGSATGSLDSIAIAGIEDGDIAMVGSGDIMYFYQFNCPDTTAESSPLIVRPDGYGATNDCGADGQGVWKLSGVTGGTILGKMNVVVTTDGTESPTASQMYGTMFIADHDTATSDTDYTLPGVEAGMSACFYDNGGGTGGIIIDAAAGDEILLDGATVGAGDAIDSPGVAGDGANGDFICIMGIDTTYWITLGRSGTWVDGGAD